MNISPSIAKITRPRLPQVFRRERLLNLLDDRERPVIWVSGPAGSGKTTLVCDYLDARNLPCLWYKIDEGDSDIASFFYYMGLAAKKAAPRKRTPLPLLTHEYLLGIPTFTKRYFENLYSRLKSPSVVVFDNYQHVPEESAFHELIRNGLSEIPRGIQVVLISRGEPPAVFARMQANKVMDLIGWEQLQLTLEETSGVMKLRSGKPFSKEYLRRVYEKSRGWLVGVVLMEVSLRRSGGQSEPDEMVPGRLSDYFVEEIFRKTDEDLRDFLLKTAFLPRMTPQMAEAITGNSRAGLILTDLHRRNSFTEKSAERGNTYQYHAMFREFLQKRAEHEYSEAVRTNLRLVAAKLLEESGQTEDAANLYIEADDRQGLAGLALRHAPQLMAQGRGALLESWLAHLSPMLDNAPWFLYWKAVCRLPFNPGESQGLFEKAFQRFEESRDATGVFLAWAGTVESIFFAFENLRQLDHWIGMFPSLEQRQGGFPSGEIEGRVASAMVAAIVIRELRSSDYDTWLEKALAVNDLNLKIRTLFYHAFRHIFQGNVAQYRRVIESLHDLAKSPGAAPMNLLQVKVIEQMAYQHCWLPGQYPDSAQEGLRIAEESGVHISDAYLLCHGANAALALGDFGSARMSIQRTAAIYDHLSLLEKSFFHLISATESYLLKDSRKALAHIEPALNYADQVGQPSSSLWCLLMYALILRDLGEPVKADELLPRLYSLSRDAGSETGMFEYHMTKAQFDLDRGKKQSALSSLRKAMEIGKEYEFFGTFLVRRPSDFANLAVVALENKIEVEYVRELIRRRRLVPESTPYVESWPWPMTIFTFGRFSLLENGKPIHFSAKGQKKPLEMLKAVIVMGGREVGEQQITDALWPEAEGDAGRMLFKTTLHRLRLLTGNNKAIVVQEGRVTLDNRLCWVDAWAFERLLGEAEKLWVRGRERSIAGSSKDKAAEAVMLTEKALALYQGPFLEADADASWMVSPREHLKMRYVRAVGRLASHWEQARKYEKATDCYQSALRVDDLTEEFYQRLMFCYKKLGRKAEAIKTYRRCCSVLKANMGVEPSGETTAIYRNIMQ
jgi:DNA-binding SARP family transcriptional activator